MAICGDINKCFPMQVVACSECKVGSDGCKAYNTKPETESTEGIETIYTKQF